MDIRVTGWKAILILVVLGAFAGYRYIAARTSLDTAGADELRFWLAAEYQREGLPDLRQAITDGDAEEATARAQEIVARGRIEFTELDARGTTDDLAVRVRVLVDGREPPDGRPVRYFRMRYSTVTGWRMQRETTALSYHLNFF